MSGLDQMLKQCKYNSGHDERLVGDPVDVVTGANIEVNCEFQLPGPIPFIWQRYYDSSKNNRIFALGRGHTHEYDHMLQFDLDGLRYTMPMGNAISFPPLLNDGDHCSAGGLVLLRVNLLLYQIIDGARPVMEFEFRDIDTPAPLKALRQGASSIDFAYSQNGLLESIRDSQGRLITVANDQKGCVLSLTLFEDKRPAGRVLMSFRYDESANLIECADVYRNSFSFKYDQNNRLISRTDRRGYSFHYEYDGEGRCVRSRGEDGLREIRLRYLPNVRVTVVTKADGGEWQYFYDENGVITRIIEPYGGVRSFILDESGRVIEERAPDGTVVRRVYDEAGALLGRIDPAGVWYPEDGGAPLGPKPEITQPVFKPPLEELPGCFFSRFPASWGGSPFSDNPVSYEYGDLIAPHYITLPTSAAPALNEFPEFVRKLIRKRPAEEEPTGADSKGGKPGLLEPRKYPPGEYAYDVINNLIKHTDPEDGTQEWRYDRNGNIALYRDRDKQVWRYEYESWDLLSREINPLGHSLTYGHTAEEKIARVADSGGASQEYKYDLKDRLAAVYHNGVRKETYQYDDAKRLTVKSDGRSRLIASVERNLAGLPEKIEFGSGEQTVFKYDGQNRLISAITKDCELSFDYDALNNQIVDERNGLGVRHTYSCFDLKETVILGRFRVRYERREGRLIIIDPGGAYHQVQPLSHGFIRKTLSNGTQEIAQYQYEGKCLLKVGYNSRYNSDPWSRQYAYSPEGDLLEVNDSKKGRSQYKYDAAHRLISETLPNLQERSFKYDSADNLVEQPGLDNVTISNGNRMTKANGNDIEYDEQGRISEITGQDGKIRFSYNAQGLLAGYEAPSTKWSASYDPMARRISKTSGDREVKFYWDRDRLAAEVFDDGRVRIYIYANPRAKTPFLFIDYDSIDADPGSGRRHFIFTDQIGAPIRIEDEKGQTVWLATIDPYGTARLDHKNKLHDFALRFPGHYFDAETGLHYNRFRYYSPGLGRYIQPDPSEIAGGVNLYAYAPRPLTEVDVDGLCPRKIPPLEPNEESKSQAAALATAIRDKADQNPNKHGFTLHKNVTYSVMVVRMADGSKRTVVTSSGDRRSPHPELKGVVSRDQYVSPRENPPGKTGHHAEQRAMAWAAEKSDPALPDHERVVAIEAISPTRRCCSYTDGDDCSTAIARAGDPDLHVVQTPPGEPKKKVPPSVRRPPKSSNKDSPGSPDED